MEYRLFGSGQPPDDFTQQLRTFCDLDDLQREALAVWFESTADFDIYAPDLSPTIKTSTLLPEQFRRAALPIRHLLDAWHSRALQLADIERDLLLLGLDSDSIQLVSTLLQRLEPLKERIRRADLEGVAQFMGLVTLDDANIVWDARAIFGGPSYYAFDSEAEAHKQFFGLTCVAILELMTSDTNGNKERIAVQMNEKTFKLFTCAVNRAVDQHSLLKDAIKSVSSGTVGTQI